MSAQLIADLTRIVGPDHVATDEASRRFVASDFFQSGETPSCVVAPGTVDELALAVRAAAKAGHAVIARGGGLSYTGGYVPTRAATVTIDTRRLARIVEISPADMTVTAEVGVTWEKLFDALKPHGLRPPSFGPSTGRYATLGGGLSNNAMFFGAANKGTAVDSVLGLDVVLADGSLLRTGSGAIRGGAPFFRANGPDLTGLFLADAGALGVKAQATLKLEPIPAGVSYLSYTFDDYNAMIAAAASVARTGLAAECLGVSDYVPGAPGRATAPSLHVVVEGWTPSIAAGHRDVIDDIVGSHGTTIDPALPKFLRDNMFGFVANPLDAKGRRQIWTHGAFPLSKAQAAFVAMCAYFDAQNATLTNHAIDVSISIAVAGTMLIVEPVLYWHDEPDEIHRRGMGPLSTNDIKKNRGATAAAHEVRVGLRNQLRQLGAAHMQHGKFYTLSDSLSAPAFAMLKRIKQSLDPENLLNPGALGL